MKETTLTFSVNPSGLEGGEVEHEIETSCSIEDEIMDIYERELPYEIVDWGDVESIESLQDYELLREIADTRDLEHLEWEAIEAGLYLDVSLSDMGESYAGYFNSDEDFAQDLAEQLGCIDRHAQWPYTCIDWTYAAKELMWDYSEHNGYYFRNM